MRRVIPLIVLALLTGCNWNAEVPPYTPVDRGEELDMETDSSADEPDARVDEDGEPDLGPDSYADWPVRDDDMNPCACSTVDDCCDGCHPINAGTTCDDGLDCTLDTTCQDDGTCGGSTGSPCDAQLEHPDCQAAMCDEVAGCSTAPTREGLECSTPGPGTFDGICQAGVCVGQQQCECSADDGPCCDGCHIQPAGHVCDTAGATIGCDGECGGEIVTNRISFVCDGTTLECGTDPRLIEESRAPCAATELCVQAAGGSGTKCEVATMCE